MFSNHAYESARSSAANFLLGAGCAAMLVLSFAGASLALSRATADARTLSLNELRLNRPPLLALPLGGLA
ncbi:MAG: hypothetical protein ACRECX_13395 [Methyloceanibacter sp.]|uniref:hypothetical protein n=1 Tax=Methyloceanibacter sp. TaxID=1965321 RepID=UPI003D6CCDF2